MIQKGDYIYVRDIKDEAQYKAIIAAFLAAGAVDRGDIEEYEAKPSYIIFDRRDRELWTIRNMNTLSDGALRRLLPGDILKEKEAEDKGLRIGDYVLTDDIQSEEEYREIIDAFMKAGAQKVRHCPLHWSRWECVGWCEIDGIYHSDAVEGIWSINGRRQRSVEEVTGWIPWEPVAGAVSPFPNNSGRGYAEMKLADGSLKEGVVWWDDTPLPMKRVVAYRPIENWRPEVGEVCLMNHPGLGDEWIKVEILAYRESRQADSGKCVVIASDSPIWEDHCGVTGINDNELLKFKLETSPAEAIIAFISAVKEVMAK